MMNARLFSGLLAGAAAATAIGFAPAANAAQLSTEDWQYFNGFVNTERAKLDADLRIMDVTNLQSYGGPLEVYFINEGAGYKNQLLFSADGGPLQMIFENVSSPNSILKNADGPLALGEGVVSEESIARGAQVDFFLNSNAYGKSKFDVTGMTAAEARETSVGNRLLGADAEENPHGLQHMLAYELKDGWTLFAFEDIIGGGDLDYNDTVFVARGITDADVSTPEPGAALGLAGLSLLGMVRARRRRAEASEEA